jgi:DNA-binding response OmpR family regulator
VDCAYSLSEAQMKLKDNPNVILLDNNMPDGTGLEYLQMHPVEFMGSKVIMMTADPNPMLEMKARQEGVDTIIKKPFSVSNLKELIKRSA